MTACWRAHIESLWAIIWKRRRMAHCRIQELFNEVIAVIPVFSFHLIAKRKRRTQSNEWKRSFCYHLLVPQDKEKEIGTLWNQVITRRKLGLMTARYHFIAVISFLLLWKEILEDVIIWSQIIKRSSKVFSFHNERRKQLIFIKEISVNIRDPQ